MTADDLAGGVALTDAGPADQRDRLLYDPRPGIKDRLYWSKEMP
jgi:hypothetical protein